MCGHFNTTLQNVCTINRTHVLYLNKLYIVHYQKIINMHKE